MSPTLPAPLTALAIAAAVGLHVSTWGAYKDAPYEGYHPVRQARTLVLACLATIAVLALGLGSLHAVVPTIGVVYALERLATEWWKTILRRDDQAAYAIPMRLGFRGRPVDVGWLRYLVGTLVVAGLVLTGMGVRAAQAASPGLPVWWVALTVGGLGGWATAAGGAWKDAPVEGFSGWKFLRSPAVATAWAIPLALLTTDWVTLCLAAGGMAVASIETYKTFLTGGRAPGKFEGKPVRWARPGVRRALGVGHAAGWLGVALLALLAATGQPAPAGAVSAALGVLAVAAAVVVQHRNRALSPAPGVRRLPAAPRRRAAWPRSPLRAAPWRGRMLPGVSEP